MPSPEIDIHHDGLSLHLACRCKVKGLSFTRFECEYGLMDAGLAALGGELINHVTEDIWILFMALLKHGFQDALDVTHFLNAF